MDIPPHLLSQVTCSQCDSFLARSPIHVLRDGSSVCDHHDVTASRNTAYEGLAQMMRFPCRFQAKGCPDTPVWNSGHEEECVYGVMRQKKEGDGKKGGRGDQEKGEKCSVCMGNIYVLPRYECLRGHKICPTCTLPNNNRCQLCKSKISNEIIYLCKYWTFGCKFKSYKDQVSRHEIDCDMRGFSCPFLSHDCKWSGARHTMPQHLKTAHFEETISGEETTKCFRMNDDTWVMVAYEEVFQCYCWVQDSAVEWMAKYVGPQEKCILYSCELKLSNKIDKSIFQATNKCHGWNNFSLEKCIQISFDDMTKYLKGGKCDFKFKIIKN